MTEQVTSVEKDHEHEGEPSLYVPAERVQHKFLNALPIFHDVARELIARDALAGGMEEGAGHHPFDRVMIGEKMATADTLVRLLEESLGKDGDSFLGKVELCIPVAFAAVGADAFADVQELLRERPEEAAGITEEQVKKIELHVAKVRELFNISLGMKEYASFDEKSFRSWLESGVKVIQEGPINETKEAEDSSRSAQRALLPLFERFLDGTRTHADIDRMLGEIDDKAAKGLCDIRSLLINYSVEKSEKCLWQIKNGIQMLAAYRHYDRMLRRKQFGE